MSTYGYDSPRRRKARRARYWRSAWRRFRVAFILSLVAGAVLIVAWDRVEGRPGGPAMVYWHATTAPPAPAPASQPPREP